MHFLKVIGLYGFILCFLGPILFLLEVHLKGPQAQQQLAPITLVSIMFFVLTALEISAGAWLHKTNSKAITGYYLLMKVVRLLVIAMIIIIYGLLGCQNVLLFAVNVIVFFFVTLIYTSAHFVMVEYHRKKTDKK